MNEWDLIVIRKAIVEAELEMQGMIIANKERENQGHAPAYGQEAFQGTQERLNAIFEVHRQ